MIGIDDAAATRRAFAAYFRSGGFDQPSGASGVVTHGGKVYVHLHSGTRTLAVYRVRNDGRLKALRKPPKELAPDWYHE